MAVAFFSNFSPLQRLFAKTQNLRGKFINNNREFDVDFKSFGRPLIGDGYIINISTKSVSFVKILLFTNVVNTVHNGEFVVAANVVGGSINTLFHQNSWYWSGNYLFNNKLRGALSNSNEENNTKSFELEMIFAIGIEYHFLEV